MRPVLAVLATILSAPHAWGWAPLEIQLTDRSLPKIAFQIRNLDPQRTIRLWKRGMSWGDRTIHFEFRDRAGKDAGKVTWARFNYTMNYASDYELKPGAVKAFDFDLEVKEEWAASRGLDLRHAENLEVRVVLRQALDLEAHLFSAFTGEVASPWMDGKNAGGQGTYVEWFAVPAIGEGKVLAGMEFMRTLRDLRIPQSEKDKSLLDRLGPAKPWSTVSLLKDDYGVFEPTATLLFPDATAVIFYWDDKESLTRAERDQLAAALKLDRFGDGRDDQPGWSMAEAVLRKLPSRGITKIRTEGNQILGDEWQLQRDGSYRKRR